MPTGVTMSLGVASCRTAEVELEKILECADTALFRAKSLGRNRAEVWKKTSAPNLVDRGSIPTKTTEKKLL